MKESSSSSKKGIIAFVLVLVAALIVGIYNIFSSDSVNLTRTPKRMFTGKEYIAVVYVEGVIEEENYSYNQKWLLDTLEFLKNDRKNAGILLFVNSPGGAVYQADEVYLALLDYKNSGKKLYSYFGQTAASGGYYIACAADKIFASRNTLTGSIGVISGTNFDVTGLMEKLGVKSITITSGKNKNMFNFNEPVTDEQRGIMQEVADECYSQFVEIVSTGRNMELEKVKTLADGRIYTAHQALENGLIDKICTLEEAKETVKEDFTMDVYFTEFKFEEKMSIFNIMNTAVKLLKSPESFVQEKLHSRPMYLYRE